MGATVLEVAFADAAAARHARGHRSTAVAPGAEADGAAGPTPRSHDGARTAMEVLRALDAAGLAVGGLTVREPSLDDVFLTAHRPPGRGRADAAPTTTSTPADERVADRPQEPLPPTASRTSEVPMTTADPTVPAPPTSPPGPAGHRRLVAQLGRAGHAWPSAKRNLLHYTRVPQLLVFTFVQPIMFVLLFRYVFGGTIVVPGLDYVDYLMPGIFGQTVVFGATSTAIGLAEDLGSGIIERFRSLPDGPHVGPGRPHRRRPGPQRRRRRGDAGRSGWPSASGPRAAVLGVRGRPALLVLAFAFALSWIMALRRAQGGQRRGGPGGGVPAPVPAHLRLVGVRARSTPCPAGSRSSPPTSRSPWWSTPPGA